MAAVSETAPISVPITAPPGLSKVITAALVVLVPVASRVTVVLVLSPPEVSVELPKLMVPAPAIEPTS